MSVWAVIVVFVAGLNPFRRRTCLTVDRTRDVCVGAALAVVAYVVIATLGTTVRDQLDVSAPNARVAAGLVLIAVGLHAAVTKPPRLPASETTHGWLVPVFFPVVFRPDLALVALAAERANDAGTVALAAVAATAATTGWFVAHRGAPRYEHALSALCGVVLVFGAVRLVLDGVFAL